MAGGLVWKVKSANLRVNLIRSKITVLTFFFFATPRGFISVDLNKLKNLSNLGQLEPYDYLDLDLALGLEGWDIQTLFFILFYLE